MTEWEILEAVMLYTEGTPRRSWWDCCRIAHARHVANQAILINDVPFPQNARYRPEST